MDYSFVRGRVEAIRERIEAAALRAGRSASAIELLAVTKFHPIEAAIAAFDAGLTAFGESRVQEAEAKYPDFLAARPTARLDMIGHIQSNKAKKALAIFSRLQSVDSAELIVQLDRRAREAELKREILLELHTGEASKEGFRGADELYRALESLLSIEDRRLEPRGLMTMAPALAAPGSGVADEAAVRNSFGILRATLDGVRSRFGADLGGKGFDILSMGMSGDFELAVEEGSTLLRIGTALFGMRAA